MRRGFIAYILQDLRVKVNSFRNCTKEKEVKNIFVVCFPQNPPGGIKKTYQIVLKLPIDFLTLY